MTGADYKIDGGLTAVLDGYVSIPLASAVIPFTSGYERFWLGLGAVALNLIIAMILTSLVRGRLPRRWWRSVHLLAYLSWPVALAHTFGFVPGAAEAIFAVARSAGLIAHALEEYPHRLRFRSRAAYTGPQPE